MSRKNKNIVRYVKTYNWNSSIYIVLLFVVYLIFVVIAYMNQKHITPYLVEMSSIENHDTFTGLITRNEEVVTAQATGYINYYVQNGERTPSGSTIYTIDETGQFSELVKNSLEEGGEILEADQWYALKSRLSDLSRDYCGKNFSKVYAEKNRINNMITNYFYDSAVSKLESTIDTSGYLTFEAPESMVVLYDIDGYESFTPADLSENVFQTENYTSSAIKSGDLIAKGDQIYKKIVDDSWKIYFPITEKNDSLIDRTKTKITLYLIKTKETIRAPYEIIKGGDDQEYVCVSFSKDGYGYLSDRYINFRIVSEAVSGLLIPKKAVKEQDFYIIPKAYLKRDSRNDELGFNVISPSLGDEAKFRKVNLYALIDDYYYVSKEDFIIGDFVVMDDALDRYYIGPSKSLTGVYKINQGYARFRKIEILGDLGDSYIINPKSTYGISVYDHIALDAANVEEFDLIK